MKVNNAREFNMRILGGFFLLFLVMSCTKFEDFREKSSTDTLFGYRAKAILTADQVKRYSLQDPFQPKNIGKVAVEGKYLFINEYGKGIHVFDNSTPSNPVNKVFISIPGNRDFFVKDLVFLADNGTNLISLDAKVVEEVVLKGKTLKDLVDANKSVLLLASNNNVFKYPQFPIQRNIFFECPDTTKGLIVEWERVKLAKQPNCFR